MSVLRGEDGFTAAERARYEGLVTAVTLAYIKDRDPATLLADSVEFQESLLELVHFCIGVGAEVVAPGITA